MTDNITSEKNGEELYRRFLSGDETAFEELVGLYRNGLTRYIYAFVNDDRDAEELMIDAFAELSVSKKYSGKSSLKTYLYAIGRNIALRHVKKYRRAGGVPIEDIAEETEDFDNLPEMDFVREDERARLHSAMRKLKTAHREVLHLRGGRFHEKNGKTNRIPDAGGESFVKKHTGKRGIIL